MEQMDHLDASVFHGFAAFVQKNLRAGCDAFGQPRRYLSRQDQLDYFERRNVLAALKAQLPHSSASIDTIREKYPGVFSTLVFCQKIHCLESYFFRSSLHDDVFPLDSDKPPLAWPEGPTTNDLFATIQKHQWQFFPLVFDRNLARRTVAPDVALPVLERELLQGGDGHETNVYKIKIDPAYNKLEVDDHGDPTQDTFALKVQLDSNSHRNEVKAYTVIRNMSNPPEYIVKYYGSFIQGEAHCLILEHADGGNFLEYLKKTPPPSDPQDRLMFWKSYSGYIKGIRGVHQAIQSIDDEDFLGLHGDIKPDNMLLMLGKSGSPYEFTAKITDFGHSDMRSVPAGARNRKGIDRHGNQQYSAPEASHHTLDLEKGPNWIEPTADIFALGAVTSDVIVWMGQGLEGMKRYYILRKQAIQRFQYFRGSGYSDCFHNGVDLLPEVKAMHAEIAASLPEYDIITRQMIKLVEEEMLLGPIEKRSPADKLQRTFDLYHEEATRGMTPQRPALTTLPAVSLPLEGPISTGTRPWSAETTVTMASVPNSTPNSPPWSPVGAGQRATSQDTTATLDGIFDHHGKALCSSDALDKQQGSCPPTTKPPTTRLTTDALAAASGSSSSGPDVKVSSRTLAPSLPAHGPKTSTSSAPPLPRLDLEALSKYRKLKEAKKDVPKPLRDSIANLQGYIGGRDHLIYIDDSDSMSEHKESVINAFSALAFVANEADKDGIELVFASDPTTVLRGKPRMPLRKSGTKRLAKILRAREFKKPHKMMPSQFELFITRVILPRITSTWRSLLRIPSPTSPKKDTTVLIFTDGRWAESPGRAAGVEIPVMTLMRQLVWNDIGPTRVALSFVQFGDDPLGKERLAYLDDCGRERQFPDKSGAKHACDIVDTGPITGNICKLFIGSIAPDNDNDMG
ncbi:hypothetical protein B0T19DRAFT_404801 [Cercophora scortea]|uniref:Protein kinase domain-containing protein n=1 Tax=Cercophora scortea TaxID=314031 RepID=A0AAE0M5M0_9PEZI|nr:hypothetical protein B0T19DRAFT_404801 [Cercophora scortea]